MFLVLQQGIWKINLSKCGKYSKEAEKMLELQSAPLENFEFYSHENRFTGPF